MTAGLPDEAWLGFIAALTLLLAASVLVVIRQPPWIPPPPAEETGGQHAGLESVDRRPAYPGPSYGRHSAGLAAGPVARPLAGQGAAPLPVRQPGQSGWSRPMPGGLAGPEDLVGPEELVGPNDGPPRVAGGPPWGPAPRPPGASA